MRQIFLDTETTGLSAEGGDRVVEIGCVELVNRRLTGKNLHFYLNPERDSHEAALKVHGLTTQFLSDKPLFAAVAEQLIAYLQDAEIIIHNASFDVGFLNAELRRVGHPKLPSVVAKITDSLVMAREMFPGKANSLDALCRRLEVDNGGRSLHGALLDAGLLADVYVRMTRGQNTLDMSAPQDTPAAQSALQAQALDLSTLFLPVIAADLDELALHEAVLQELDKASAGQTQWRVQVGCPAA
jgi:DNA polymerase III subunit epsilon